MNNDDWIRVLEKEIERRKAGRPREAGDKVVLLAEQDMVVFAVRVDVEEGEYALWDEVLYGSSQSGTSDKASPAALLASLAGRRVVAQKSVQAVLDEAWPEAAAGLYPSHKWREEEEEG